MNEQSDVEKYSFLLGSSILSQTAYIPFKITAVDE
jgi:hypothetical protein